MTNLAIKKKFELKSDDIMIEFGDHDEFRRFLASSSDDFAIEDFIYRCNHTLTFSRHHWLMFKESYVERADLKKILSNMASIHPSAWNEDETKLAIILYSLSTALIGLEQLTHEITLKSCRDVLEERYSSYMLALGQAAVKINEISLISLSEKIARLRPLVENYYYRISIIDGKAWHRTEVLSLKSALGHSPTPELDAVLEEYDADSRLGLFERIKIASINCIKKYEKLSPLLLDFMQVVLSDDSISPDHVTLTCPRGESLLCPHAMNANPSQHFYTDTLIKSDLDLSEYAEQLGHQSLDRIRRITQARMYRLKHKAVNNFYYDGCLFGQMVEKSMDYMIFRNEDSHYPGHRNIGCSTGGRAAFSIEYTHQDTVMSLPPMLADLRVVRLSHAPERTFNEKELLTLIWYSEIFKSAIQVAFNLGAVVEPSSKEELTRVTRDVVAGADDD